MSNIPEDVKDRIKEEAERISYDTSIFEFAGAFGYSLAQDEVKELKAEVKRFKGLVRDAYTIGARDQRYNNVDTGWAQFLKDNKLDL